MTLNVDYIDIVFLSLKYLVKMQQLLTYIPHFKIRNNLYFRD